MSVATTVTPTSWMQQRANFFNGLGCRYSIEVVHDASLLAGLCSRVVYHKINN